MSSKKYAFLPMGDDELGPAKVTKEKKEKRSKHRHRDHDRNDRDRGERSSRRRSRSRSRSPYRPAKQQYRKRDTDADDRWADEEPPSDIDDVEEEPEFKESAPKRSGLVGNTCSLSTPFIISLFSNLTTMVLPTVSFVSLVAISLAGIVASQSDDFDCCFTLEVSGDLGGKLKHGTTGDLRVNSNFQEAFMCAYESSDKLQDSIGNNCRFSSPSMKFECLSGVPGDGDFFFDFGEATDGGEKPILLTYDGHDKFLACPSEGPSSDAGSFVLYSRAKEDQEGCVDVSLQQVGPSSSCYDRGLLEKFRSPTKSTRAPVTGTIEEVSPARKSCTLSDTSTRLPAKRVGSGSLDSLIVNPDGWASINDENSTIFEFEMAPLWVNHPRDATTRRCAVEFRFPACSNMPEGYPCAVWSGSEQQDSAGAGMEWYHVYTRDDPAASSLETSAGPVDWAPWDDFYQFGSEDAITVGTFECGVDRSGGIIRTISFLVESVNGWSLSFAQAGMGTQSQWPLGVGAYVTACDDTTPWP
ncbi:hypothetical protein BN1723_005709 [Verticillium longisporum]|uniref:Ubiquitin 3 binding protein But2 C-terminal domain-containing protein n=1 Tax=Verticillium longisporum TaxID=100787 RepID=A0A0G4NAP3_VERLO|nr:hypothetical protein BN1723_005709 [Verticillium longisporum]